MFQKIHHKLALLCCAITSGIVLIVILICLFVSEKNMYNEEEAYFVLKANSISFDLISYPNLDRDWYSKHVSQNEDTLYLTVDDVPSSLSTLLLPDSKKALIAEIEEYLLEKGSTEGTLIPLQYTYSSYLRQTYFEYKNSESSYMIMSGQLIKNSSVVEYLYLHSLADFQQRVLRQRIIYFTIWLVSIGLLYLFSFYFTAHTLKPLMQNYAKQKQFTALASHELRSPLAVFKTGLSILKGNPDPVAAEHFYPMLEGEIGRMERLVNDLLFLSKAEQSSLNYQFETANLAHLLDSVYQKYLPIGTEKEVLLTQDIQTSGAPLCVCDAQRMEQVMIILLDNALTYTPAGGRITLRLQVSRNKYLLSVEDTGTGISDDEKEKIFDKFYQANPSHSNKNHFGLGLSIAKEICRAHKGSITVSDTLSGGSTFTVSLPMGKASK